MLKENEERELSGLVDELQLSDFERRRRRMIAAQGRVQALAELQGSRSASFSEVLRKQHEGEPLSDDEFILAHLGFTREGWANGEPMRELERRKAGPFAGQRAVNTKAESN